MFKIKIFLVLIFSCFSCFSQEIPTPASQDKKIDITGLVWNKWDTDNFIILSLDKDEGYNLYKTIEKTKKDVLSRWGLENFNFKEKCKIVCVKNKDYLNNFFRIRNSHVEVLKDKDDEVSSCSIWYSQDDKEFLSSDILYLCILQSEYKWWIKRGLYLLKNDENFVKSNIDENLKDFSKIILVNEEDWKKQSEQEKKQFDKTSVIACLFFRKEFGQNNFLKIINSEQKEEDFEKIIGFKNYSELDKVFKRYKDYLYNDKMNNKIPYNYLEIKEAK